MFIKEYPIDKLRPADYNPRAITEESLESLYGSIEEIGMAKPVIVTPDGLIIAGHQRTKTLKKLGVDHCPAFIIEEEVNLTDEISFNQLHNASDIEVRGGLVTVPPSEVLGWEEVEADSVMVNMADVGTGAIERNEMMKLITQYGDWGACIATQSGEVLISRDYAICCKILGVNLRIFRVADDKVDRVRFWFNKDYGYFSYQNLEKTTYVQTMAQPIRLRANKNNLTSYTYELFIIPFMKANPNARVLDFGAGQMDYVKHLQAQGFNIKGFEPFFRKKGKLAIDLETIRMHVDAVCEDLTTHGLYDIIICDAVINSVDSLQSEIDVLVSLGALCKKGGKIFYAGRSLYQQLKTVESAKKRGNVNDANTTFLDANNFTATYTRGYWLYQKFHSLEQIHEMTKAYITEDFKIYNTGQNEVLEEKQISKYFYVVGEGKKQLPLSDVIPSLRREFDMMQPQGNSIGRADEIEDAYLAALAIEKREGRI